MRGQLVKTTDPGLMCNFPDRLVLMANHQIYTDWLYLWWIGYTAGMHGRIFVVLKESLKKIPVLGWGMQFAQFIFLKRNWEQDKPSLAKHMQKLNVTKDPMWLMLFPEGTNLASCTREKSRLWANRIGVQDMKHTLLPRSTGLHFMLSELKDSVDYVYDCTIAYEGVPHGSFAQDIFTVGASYFGGRPPKSVNMYWRRFRMSTIPLEDPKKFELWLRLRWREKDKFIDHYLKNGRFPADSGSSHNPQGEAIHGAGYIEAEIRPKYWYEFLQVFAPIGLFALVLYLFYGSLPQDMVNNIKSVDQKTVLKQIEAIQKGELKVPETKDLMASAPPGLQDKFNVIQKIAAEQNTTPEKIIAEAKKSLPAGALPAGDPGPKPMPKPAATRVSNAKVAAPATQTSHTKTGNHALSTPSKADGSKAQSSLSKKPVPDASHRSKTIEPLGNSTGNVKSGAALSKISNGKPDRTKQPTKDTEVKAKPVATSKPSATQKPSTLPSKLSTSKTIATKSTATAKAPTSSKTRSSIAPKVKSPTQKRPKASKPLVTNASQQTDSSDKEALRHMMKKEARLGKQEPKRKVRRALQSSAATGS